MKQTLRTAGAVFSLLLISLPTIAQESDSTLLVHRVNGIKITNVIGTAYGDKDVTKLTEHVPSASFNKGLITTPEQLITGQFTGLQVVQGSGKPGRGDQLIIRNGATVFGRNAPLIVIDGVALEDTQVSDHAGSLSFLDPQDIAAITLLKDAASNSMYGSRAINGVLFITTKRGGENAKPRVTYQTTGALSVLRKKAEILDSDEFRDLVKKEYPDKVELLGTENTDWQDVIYREAFSHDHNLSVSGTGFSFLPYRISAGYLTQNGILETSQNKRTSLALSLNPSFFNDHLRLNLNVRKIDQDLRVANERAIGAAFSFNPTQPVYQQNNYGNYFAYLHENGTADVYAPNNPLSLLEQHYAYDETNTLQGKAHLQYKLHFFPQLSLNARYAFRDQENKFNALDTKELAATAGTNGMLKKNSAALNWTQKEAFLILEQPLNFLESELSLTLGAQVRNTEYEKHTRMIYDPEGDEVNGNFSFYSHQLEFTSLFGNAAINIKDRYILSGALTQEKHPAIAGDATQNVTWGIGSAWDIAQENFMIGIPAISQLRLFANYSHFIKPDLSAYQYSTDQKFENTTKWNTGLSWGILENKFSGDINYFQTKTRDLYTYVHQVSAGGPIIRYLNAGVISSKGLEATVNYDLISNETIKWIIGGNASYAETNTESLYNQLRYFIYGSDFITRFALTPGKPINSFLLYEQIYDEGGKPVEGEYWKNQNGVEQQMAMGQKDPKWMFGLQSTINYKKLSASFLLRAATGHQVFNFADASRGALAWVWGPNYLENITRSYYDTGFENTQRTSSYYLEDASFLRLEYLQVGYQLGSVWKDRANVNLTATAQNAFVLTKYSGQDPEVSGGIDNGQYPRPATFSLGLKVEI